MESLLARGRRALKKMLKPLSDDVFNKNEKE